MSLKKGQQIELTVEKAAFEGKGLGKANGFSVFVPNTAPGDVVKAQIIKKKSNYAEARLLEIVKPGEIRIKPKCSHAVECGGCSWQHLPYEKQVEFKRQHVEDHIRRIGGFPDVPVHQAIGSASAFGYRNKMEFTFGDRRWLTQEEINSEEFIQAEGFVGGMHAPGRFDRILHLNECHLMHPYAFEMLDFTRKFAAEFGLEPWNPVHHTGFLRNLMIRNSHYFPDLMVNVVTFGENDAFMKPYVEALLKQFPMITTITQNVNDTKSPTSVGRYENVLFGPGFIRDKIGEFQFNIHPNAFFQTNTRQAEQLYEVARDFADIQQNDVVYDLYCGVGTLTLFMSGKASKVVGIELNPVSIKNAEQNMKDNNVEHVSFELGDMKDTFNAEILAKHGNPNVIIIDPPRAGMHPDVVQELLNLKCPKIVYVSCNSSTLARDLALMKDVYEVLEVQPVDMFPQTYHIESVANLRLKV
ncbi:23S rRNA (uracil(1939)-C(5))-methyltransferase RlmD [bacterium]|nr:MAG: 23S rRNA (uracil(1939)-C(5))-methyltransferase RlmD [bacterium]